MEDNISAVYAILEQNGVFTRMFDLVRMVDPVKGVLLEYGTDQQVHTTSICCTNVFGSEERCRNCTSTRAFYADKTMVKLEYANGAVLLIFSTPVKYNGARLIIEMVKDITDSMTVDVKDQGRLDGVTHMIQNLSRLATTDVLTGLFNRRYLDKTLPKVVESCHRTGESMCVALLDIDNFKRVNDVYGHQAGDLVLKATADSVSSFVRRGSDWGARYGGEEIFVCFVGVGMRDGQRILERIRQHVEENLVIVGQEGISVTVSVGLAEVQRGETARDLIARCDRLLYQAKHNGKNRVEYIDEEALQDSLISAGT